MNPPLTPDRRQNVERLLESIYGEIRAVVSVEPVAGSTRERLAVTVHSRSITNEAFEDHAVIWRAAEYELRLLALLAMQGVALPPVVFGKPDKDRNGDVIMAQLPQWHGPGLDLATALAAIHAANAGPPRSWMRTVGSAADALAIVDFRKGWQAGLADASFRAAVAPYAESLRSTFDAVSAAIDEARNAGPSSLLHLGHQASDLRDRSGRPVLMEWATAVHGPVHLDVVLRLPEAGWPAYLDALESHGVEFDAHATESLFQRLLPYPKLVRLSDQFERWLNSPGPATLAPVVELLKALDPRA